MKRCIRISSFRFVKNKSKRGYPDDVWFLRVVVLQRKISGKEWLRLIYPGETVEIPLNRHRHTGCCSGVLFHPDLLCDTSLENRIETYPKRCCCKGTLSEHERNIITDNLREIGEELHHAIDRHSASIIASHIELLLNYCIRFCNQ